MDLKPTTSQNSTRKQESLPQFIVKLRHILENPAYRKAISWGDSEGELCINSQRQLQLTVLPQFFRHHKTESFVRQLNNYGFSKLPTAKIGEDLRFRNPFFLRDNPKAMKHIKRKSKRGQKESIKPTESTRSSQVSIAQMNDIVELAAELAGLVKRHPAIRPDLNRAFQIMGQLVSTNQSAKELLEEEEIKADYNLLQTVREDHPSLVKLSSTCSFDDGLNFVDF